MADSPEKIDNVIDLEYTKDTTTEPFTMSFCFPKSGPVLVKGALDKVIEYMENNLEGVYHYRLSHWRKGQKRGKWYVMSSEEKLFFKEEKKGKSKSYTLTFQQFGKDITVETFKTIPHNYIDSFDLFQVNL